jgi:hypothetical protein
MTLRPAATDAAVVDDDFLLRGAAGGAYPPAVKSVIHRPVHSLRDVLY